MAENGGSPGIEGENDESTNLWFYIYSYLQRKKELTTALSSA
jgi:hypothetical protein